LAGERQRGPRLPTQFFIGAVMVIAIIASLAAFIANQLDQAPEEALTPDQRAIVLKLQSVLLHDTVVPQYARVSLEPDDRGYVAGIGDFATADGSALEIIDAYTARVGPNVLSRDYGAILAQLASEGSPDTSALDGYADAWRAASRDPVFQQVQDNVLQASYLEPAIEAARAQGVHSPLGIAIFFDSLLQHGDAAGPDSLSAVVTLANATASSSTYDEHSWLERFLKVREGVLLNPAEANHQRLWPLTVTRVRTLAELVRAGNWDLTPPIRVNPYGTAHYLDARPPTVTLPSLVYDVPTETATTDPSTPTTSPTSPPPARPTGGSPASPPAAAPSAPAPPPLTTRLVGQIVGVDGVCLDVSNGRIDLNFVKTWECNGTPAQIWAADPDGTISVTISPPPEPGIPETACLRPRSGSAEIKLDLVACNPADPNQQWRFENGHIRNVGIERCLAVPNRPDYYGHAVLVATCSDLPGQIWSYPN